MVYLNAAGCALLGLSDEEAVRLRTRGFADMLSSIASWAPDGRVLIPDQAIVWRLLSGEVISSERAVACPVTTPEGSDVYLSFSGGPIRDANGTIQGAIVTGHDVSAQVAGKAREEAMRRAYDEQTARFRTLLDLLPAGVAVYDAKGELVEMNAEGRRITQRQVLSGEVAPDRQARYAMRHGDGSLMPEVESPSGRARRGIPFSDAEYIIDGVQGPETHILTSGAPLPSFSPSDGAARQREVEEDTDHGAIVVFQDVTALRRLERLARDQANLAEGIIDSSPFGVILFDVSDEFRVLRHNQPYLNLVGADVAARGSLEGVSLDAFFDAASAARTRAIFEHVRATGETAVIDEYEAILPPDPMPRYYRWSLQPLRDASGKITALVGTALEITREVRSRREAEALARRLQTVLDVLPMGMAVVDAQGAILHVNGAFRRVWEGDVPLARDIAGYGEYVAWWPDGRPVAPDEWAMARALTRGEVVVGEEVEIQTFSGQRKVIINNAAPVLDDQGRVTGGVVAFLDITSRRQLETRTRASLDALLALAAVLVSGQAAPTTTEHPAPTAPAGGPEMPQDLRAMMREVAALAARTLGCARVAIATVDPASEVMMPVAILGFTPEQEARWWSEWQPQCTVAQRMGEHVATQLRAGEVARIDLGEAEARQRLAPYTVRNLLVAPMRVEGQVVGLLAFDDAHSVEGFTTRDEALASAVGQLAGLVVERDRLLREHAETEARVLALSATNRLMNEFLGIAGHELRTPLTSMRINAQLAKMTARRAEGAEDLPPAMSAALARIVNITERIDLQSRRQERLVNDLLDVSRLDAGKLELHVRPVDLVALAREAVEEQRLLNPERAITLSHVPDDARGGVVGELVVEADPDRVSQVITNYLSNALKYSPEEQPVAVSVARVGETARVSVRDCGPGIPSEAQSSVWQRFHRVEGIRVQSGSGIGLGLGLYICRELIERHGGTVDLESAPGQGSTFSFSLPLTRQESH